MALRQEDTTPRVPRELLDWPASRRYMGEVNLLLRSVVGGWARLRGGRVSSRRCARTRRPWAGRSKRAALALGLLGALEVCVAGPRGMPAQEGIVNFGKVSAVLYRGAQPDAAGLKHLQRLGVKTIISLNMPGKDSKTEAAESAATGLVYTNVPLHGLGRPNDEQVKMLLLLLESSAWPVFVHCEHGCDRTGTIIACYRIQHDRWTTQAAMREAEQYGLSRLERGMRKFILEFGKAHEKR